MEELNLFNNTLEGALPDTLSECESLQVLDAENNMLSGDPFTVLKDLFTLRSIRLSENRFTGELSDDSIRNLLDLHELWIGGYWCAEYKR
jgi:hypothetical protein